MNQKQSLEKKKAVFEVKQRRWIEFKCICRWSLHRDTAINSYFSPIHSLSRLKLKCCNHEPNQQPLSFILNLLNWKSNILLPYDLVMYDYYIMTTSICLHYHFFQRQGILKRAVFFFSLLLSSSSFFAITAIVP